MKSYKHQVLIHTIKAISIAFVLLMSIGFINIMSCKETDGARRLNDEELELQYQYTYTNFIFNLFERSFLFYPFVFVLGGFWSRKKMLKAGIL